MRMNADYIIENLVWRKDILTNISSDILAGPFVDFYVIFKMPPLLVRIISQFFVDWRECGLGEICHKIKRITEKDIVEDSRFRTVKDIITYGMEGDEIREKTQELLEELHEILQLAPMYIGPMFIHEREIKEEIGEEYPYVIKGMHEITWNTMMGSTLILESGMELVLSEKVESVDFNCMRDWRWKYNEEKHSLERWSRLSFNMLEASYPATISFINEFFITNVRSFYKCLDQIKTFKSASI